MNNKLTIPLKTLKFFFFFGLILMLQGCMVKSTLKKGASFETAGMFKDAADLYYGACLKKPTNPDLRIALKRAGQLYIDEQAEVIGQSFNRGEYKTTVYGYVAVRDFVDKVSKTGIELRPDPSMQRWFEDAKVSYLAQRYEEGQRLIGDQKFDESRVIFAEIYQIDQDYRDTRNYLKQATFEPLYQEGARLFGEGKYMEAYRKWASIMNQDRNYKDVADQMSQALNERYKQGSVFLMNEQFADAAQALGDVYRADPGFRDVRILFAEARNEPVYRNGNHLLSVGKCRTAYFEFDKVVQDAGVYKDAAALRDKALGCAQYPVAVTTAGKRGNNQQIQQFQSTLMGQMLNQKSLFLKVYDLGSVDQYLAQALIHSAGGFDVNLLRPLSGKQNIQALLYVEFTDFQRYEGNLQRESKTGFERTVTKNAAGESISADTKVTYDEYHQRNNVTMTLVWRLVSVTTGETLLSDRISENASDEIRYANYTGSKDKLYPSVYQNGAYSISTSNYFQLQNLLKASRNILTLNTLTERIFASSSKKIATAIHQFNPEK